MITLQWIYWLTGAYLAAIAWRGLRDRGNPRRLATGGFWALLSIAFLAGERLPAAVMGAMVVALALIAGFGGVRLGRYDESTPQAKASEARRLGNRLFVPALLIPAVTLLCALGIKHVAFGGVPLLDPKHTTLVVPPAVFDLLESAGGDAERAGLEFTLTVVKKIRAIDGIAGIHLMGVGRDDLPGELTTRCVFSEWSSLTAIVSGPRVSEPSYSGRLSRQISTR